MNQQQYIKTVSKTSYLGFRYNPDTYDRLINVQIMMDRMVKK